VVVADAAALRELEAAGVAVKDVTLRRPTLDEVLLRLTGAGGPDRDKEKEAAA